mgnify:CR=1 FL=1
MFKFTGFTEKANKSLNAAVKAAEDLGHTYIGSEHILLGLLSDTSTVAGAGLAAHNITYRRRAQEKHRRRRTYRASARRLYTEKQKHSRNLCCIRKADGSAACRYGARIARNSA